jgi:hypothetical protein
MVPHRLLRYFRFEHLPPQLQVVSRPFSELAHAMVELVPDDGDQPELTAGLRKLLESKDCMVRAALPPGE